MCVCVCGNERGKTGRQSGESWFKTQQTIRSNGKYFNRLYKLCIQIFQVAAKPSVSLLCFVLFINSVVIPIRRVAIHSSRIIVVQFTRNERNERGKKERNANKKTFEWIFAGIVFENNRRLMRKLNAIPNVQLGMHLYQSQSMKCAGTIF